MHRTQYIFGRSVPAIFLFVASLFLSSSASFSEVCGGAVENLPFDVAPPMAPQTHTVPDDAIRVESTAQLQAALAWNPAENATRKNIILADGVYTPGDLDFNFLYLYGSHRLWAEHVGNVILKFGIHIGSAANTNLEGGAELHGLSFDIDDEIHGAISNPAHRSFAVLTWGTARGVKIEDCSFDGGNVVDLGIGAYRSDGLEVRRVQISNFKRFGIFTSIEENYPWTGHAVLEDINVFHIGDNEWARSLPPEHPDYDPAYPNYDPADPYKDTQEIAIWNGAPGRLSRARVRDIARVGVIAANRAFGVIMEDLDVDQIGWRPTGPNPSGSAGLYFDNRAYHSTFRNFCVGPKVAKGLTSEWDNNTFARGVRNQVEDGLLEAYWLGIFFDQGTVDSRVERVYFRNASWAGLTMYNNTWHGDDASSIEVLYRDLHDVGLPPGSCLVTAHHPYNPTPCVVPPPNPQNP